MDLLVLVLVAVVLTAGLAAVYLRLSPLQALLDERTALFGAREGRSSAEAAEGTALLAGLRTLNKEQTALLHHERMIAEKIRAYLAEERATSQALCAQLNAGRHAFEGLCAQLNAERLASQALRDQLDEERWASEGLRDELEAQRMALLDFVYRESAPELVERATQAFEARLALRAAHTKWSRPRGEALAALRRDDETRREGILLPPAALGDQLAAHAKQARDQGQNPAARAEEEQPVGERVTGLPTTPYEIAAHSELVAATAAGDENAEGIEPTRAWSSADMTAALAAEPGDEDAEGVEPTRAWSSADMTAALAAEAGGATRLPQLAPRALLSGAVAPPASASRPLSDVPAIQAAGLWPSPSEHGAPPPAPPRRTVTQMGMPAVHPQAPGGPLTQRAPRPVPRAAKTLLSMPAQAAAPTSSPSASEAPPPARDTHESLPLFFTVAREAGK